jgi:hypothetical protein
LFFPRRKKVAVLGMLQFGEKTDPTHVTCNTNAHNDEKKEEEEEENTQLNTDDDDDDARRFRPPGSNYFPPNRVRRVCLDRHRRLALSRSVRYLR